MSAARVGYKYGNVWINLGFGRFARAGSCALVCLVHNNKVYTANAGDSLGLLIEESKIFMMVRFFFDEVHRNKQRVECE